MYQRLNGRACAAGSALLLFWPAWSTGRQETAQESISQEISHALITVPFYTVFDYLGFRVEDGTVTLVGDVTRPAIRSDAEKAVMQAPGVRHVINQIEVLPTSATDGRIRLAEYLAVYGDYGLNQYQKRAVPPIHIIVKNGAVTLEGTVSNQADKQEAFTQASGVPGVVSLTNHLKIGT